MVKICRFGRGRVVKCVNRSKPWLCLHFKCLCHMGTLTNQIWLLMKWRGCSYQSVHTETVYPQQSLRSGFQTLQCLILNKRWRRWRRCQIASWIEDVYFWCGASPGDHIFSCNTLMCHIGANYSFSHLLINLLVFLPHTRFLLLIDWPYITIRGLWIPIAALIY